MLKYHLSFFHNTMLKMAEWIMGLRIKMASNVLKKKSGPLRYLELSFFRDYCNARTKILIHAGGGKQIIPQYSMNSTDGSIILNLDNYCVDGQSVHPDVIFDSKRRVYLMAISEFPYKNDAYEIPIVLYSKDGEHWKWSQKLSNVPVRPIPKHILGYHSDPALLKIGNDLFLFDRTVIVRRDGTAYIYIDQFYWNKGWKYKGILCSAIASWDNHELLLSPSLLEYCGNVHCWYCEKHNDVHIVRHMVFNEEWNMQSSEVCLLSGLTRKEYIWHLDICEYQDQLLMAADIKIDNLHTIWLMKSIDGGTCWTKEFVLASPQKGFSENSVYRGSIAFNGEYLSLYYSGRNYSEYWQTAKKNFSIN